MYLLLTYKGKKIGGVEFDLENQIENELGEFVKEDYEENGFNDYTKEALEEDFWEEVEFAVIESKEAEEQSEEVQKDASVKLQSWLGE